MKLLQKISNLTLGIILLFIPFHISAQNMSTTPTIGVKGGLLMSTVTGDDALDQYAKKMGLQIGITAATYFNPKFSLRAELNYESKGAKFDMQEMNMNLHYVSLPLYFKFNFTPDPEIYVYAGGYASYLISANTKGEFSIELPGDNRSYAVNESITQNLNQFDFGIVAGLGVQGRFNRWVDIFLDLRYTQGFMNLDKGTAELRYNFNYEEFWPEQNHGEPKNKSIMITTGIIYYFDPR